MFYLMIFKYQWTKTVQNKVKIVMHENFHALHLEIHFANSFQNYFSKRFSV